MSGTVLQFFTQMANQGGVVVTDNPNIDLDLYIHNYKGRTRFERLHHIGCTSVPLCVEALRAAVLEAKRGRDVGRYREASQHLRSAAPNDPEAVYDSAWADQTKKANKQERERLETELQAYKNNLVKESVRIGHEELGKHLESVGDLSGAAEAYLRMRPDVSTSKHIIDVGKHLVSVYLERRDWGSVLGHLNKMSVPNHEGDANQQPFLKIANGIALLGMHRYLEAAMVFLQADATIPSETYQVIASPNDVAIYGGVLALATMSRKKLKDDVLNSPNFRTMLELEPQLRRAIVQFVNGRYSSCLQLIESFRPTYLLDIHLQRHVDPLFKMIRTKCIAAYLVPYSCVSLQAMQDAFGSLHVSIEEELATMIRIDGLDARIDSIDQLLILGTSKTRANTQHMALSMARAYEKDAFDRIRRMAIVAADLEVKPPRKGSSAGLMSQYSDMGSVDEMKIDEMVDMAEAA